MLSRKGADSRNLGQIYLLVLQSVMMYRLETWVMTLCIGGVLVGLHHRVYHRLTGEEPWLGRDGV